MKKESWYTVACFYCVPAIPISNQENSANEPVYVILHYMMYMSSLFFPKSFFNELIKRLLIVLQCGDIDLNFTVGN
jgi:hypothetical protein